MAGAIDQIVIRNADGSDTLSPEEWEAIPLAERLNLLGSHRVKFFSDGKSVPVREAMFVLKKMRRLPPDA